MVTSEGVPGGHEVGLVQAGGQPICRERAGQSSKHDEGEEEKGGAD